MFHSFTKPNFLAFFLAICFCSVSSVSAQVFSDMLPPADLANNIMNAKNVKSMNNTPALTTTAPANDLCVNAQVLSGDGTFTNIDITNATQADAPHDFIAGRPAVCAAFSSNIGNGLWFTFVGNGDTFDFEVDDSNSSADLEIAIYSGTCGSLTCLAGSDEPESLFNLQTVVGTTYYIYIGSWAHFDTPSGTFDFTITGGVKACVDYEMEVATYESGCAAGPDDRVVVVTFEGDDVSYETSTQGSCFITEKGAGIFQVVGYGPWSITATDNISSCTLIVESSELPYCSDASATQATSHSATDGSATVEVTGGTAPYTVEWNNGTEGTIDASGESHTLSGLASGYYEAVVTDDDGKTAKECIYVGYQNTGGRGGRGRGKTADAITSNSLTAQPNPFSHSTTIQFELPQDAFTSVTVYSLSGKLMTTLFEGTTEAGENYQMELNASEWVTGVYILHLATDKGHVEHQRLLITK